jgi:hypothetical protein
MACSSGSSPSRAWVYVTRRIRHFSFSTSLGTEPGEVKFFIASGGVVACNDFWRTAITDYIGNLTLSDNISGDPLFCSEEAEDLRIAFQSPCAAENSPPGCGRIGAFDPACHITPTRQVSWGSIKALFRGEP